MYNVVSLINIPKKESCFYHYKKRIENKFRVKGKSSVSCSPKGDGLKIIISTKNIGMAKKLYSLLGQHNLDYRYLINDKTYEIILDSESD
jgi:hypothetical protein